MYMFEIYVYQRSVHKPHKINSKLWSITFMSILMGHPVLKGDPEKMHTFTLVGYVAKV